MMMILCFSLHFMPLDPDPDPYSIPDPDPEDPNEYGSDRIRIRIHSPDLWGSFAVFRYNPT